MDKNYRIHTNVINDTILNVDMKQDFDFLEVLSMRLNQKDVYKLHSSNYGVIIGRVLANDAFGIPNAKISVFVARDTNDDSVLESLYPYSEITSKDKEGRRYNTLPDYSNDECYRVVGTFPSKRLVLDNDIVLEVYEKYWKYTTTTNQSGDYMIFGVPSGNQQIHVDIDLSDIGILSQKPRDFEYKGYNISMFDNPNQFKEGTNLDNLVQLFSQNKSVYVYPFWGDRDNGIAAITRSDIQIQYKFEPTCIFMGSIVSDNEGHAIGHRCAPDINNGMNNQLVAGQGTIEMIRKTTDNLIEEYQIQGNQLIDEDGVWCYQIPMNLDYIGTDEYGNIVPTDNSTKGIPTRAQVRFRISKTESGGEGFSRHTAKYLVPMNPIFDESKAIPSIKGNFDETIGEMYNFGSDTPQNCFRDLYWNNVYSVKNFVPRVQVSTRANTKHYGALKGSNLVEDQNPIPYNNLKINLPFLYMVICLIFEIIGRIVQAINQTVICPINHIFGVINKIRDLKIKIGHWKIRPFFFIIKHPTVPCLSLGGDLSEDGVAFYPGCNCSNGLEKASCPDGMDSCSKSASFPEMLDRIQRNLALEFNIVKLDLNQDWINGCLYMPLWYWRKRKKKSYLFGLIRRKAKNDFCSSDKEYKLKSVETCGFDYANQNLDMRNVNHNNQRFHKHGRYVSFQKGLIKEKENKDGLTLYYYSVAQCRSDKFADDKKHNIARLYATDIILLGNLNEDNLYGIPQFFKYLPSSTANIPPIATIEESQNDKNNELVESNVDNDGTTTEDSGKTITTGMDWGHNGYKEAPTYRSGLFMDLACVYANTKPKSCINAERLCELGVNLDTNYTAQYFKGGKEMNGEIKTDGFVSKLELDDNDTRAMFATMNHIGFIPQSYQKSNNSYDTQVYDKNTNYLIPKFKYIYPTDFDGRVKTSMTNYRKDFTQPMTDELDQEYLTFRLGAESSNTSNNNSEKRIRHFYYDYSMPLYNNSFYFYFGINKGNTAIDKFNNMFYAECFNNDVKPFSMIINTQDVAFCPSIYANQVDAYGKISVKLNSISSHYTYTLYNSENTVVVSGEKNGVYELEFTNLTNQTYTLVITDENGKSLTERVRLNVVPISATYDVYPLGVKFYDTTATSKAYICDNEFYGRLEMNKVVIDGHECSLVQPTASIPSTTSALIKDYLGTDNVQILRFSLNHSDDNVLQNFDIYISVFSKDESISDCMCENSSYTFDNTTKTLVLKFYQPKGYSISVMQICNTNRINNATYDFIIENGENFNTYLNGMPLRFMIGNPMNYDSTNNFYTTDTSVVKKGWFGVHEESTYRFPDATVQNQSVWADFIDLDDVITSPQIRRRIIEFKFRNMFSLSNAVYVDGFESVFRYTHSGGVAPILYRMAAPYYSELEKVIDTYIYEDYNSATALDMYPNIVGSNYSGVTSSWELNPLFKNKKLLGNYFAAFTKNGGYINTNEISTQIKGIEKLPYKSVVNAYPNKTKKLGSKDEISISTIPNVYQSTTTTMPHLRALFVDRRFDYDFIVLGPMLHNISNGDNVYKTTRLSGVTYGGIEMAYDDNYNVISANTTINNGIMTSATANTLLEYSYEFSENVQPKTIYNRNSSVKKRFYESSFGGVDLRDSYTAVTAPFSVDNVDSNYPSKNKIDVRGITESEIYIYNNVSCSYDMTPIIDGDGNLICQTLPGGNVSFNLRFSRTPISVISGGITYEASSPSTSETRRFDKPSPDFKFTYGRDSLSSDFSVYAKTPYLLLINSNIPNGYSNNISYFKNGSSLNDIITRIEEHGKLCKVERGDYPDNVNEKDGFYYEDEELLDCEDQTFRSIPFHADTSEINLNTEFTILTQKECHDDGNLLISHVSVFELGEVYHCMPFSITIGQGMSGGTYEEQVDESTKTQHLRLIVNGLDTSEISEYAVTIGYINKLKTFIGDIEYISNTSFEVNIEWDSTDAWDNSTDEMGTLADIAPHNKNASITAIFKTESGFGHGINKQLLNKATVDSFGNTEIKFH